jgi:ABC-type sugar transport system permease subunit
MKKDDIAIVLLVIILSPFLLPALLVVLLWLWLFSKDPHIECEKGNHKYELISDVNVYRCKSCGLLR